MAEHTDVRDDLAHGRLEAAREIVENTAEEYNDRLDETDEERLKDALDAIGETMGSLMGAEHILDGVDKDRVVLASFNDRTPDSGSAFRSEEAEMLVGVRGTPSGDEVMEWSWHEYDPTDERDRTALRDVKQQAGVYEPPMEVEEAREWIEENNQFELRHAGAIIRSSFDRDLYVSLHRDPNIYDFDTPHGWRTRVDDDDMAFIRDE